MTSPSLSKGEERFLQVPPLEGYREVRIDGEIIIKAGWGLNPTLLLF